MIFHTTQIPCQLVSEPSLGEHHVKHEQHFIQQPTRQQERQGKDLITFLKEKLSELHAIMFGRKGKVKDMDQCIVELKSKGGRQGAPSGNVGCFKHCDREFLKIGGLTSLLRMKR